MFHSYPSSYPYRLFAADSSPDHYKPFRNSSSDYYRQIAEEHQRRAELALAQAREEQERVAEIERRRAAILQEERERELELLMLGQSPRRASFLPKYREHLDSPSILPSRHYPLTRYPETSDMEDPLAKFSDEEILAYLESRRNKEALAMQVAAAQEAEQQRKESLDHSLNVVLQSLGLAPTSRKQERPENPPRTQLPQSPPSEPSGSIPPKSETSATLSGDTFVHNLWNSLDQGRTYEEKATIFRGLGLTPPLSASRSKNSQVPSSGRPTQVDNELKKVVEETSKVQDPITVRITTPEVGETAPPSATSTKSNRELNAPEHQQNPAPNRRKTSIDFISGIEAKFNSLRAIFQFPSRIDFSSDSSTPTLLYNSNNASLNNYENELTKLLTKLDEVESYGDANIRQMRKSLVKAVEVELDSLDQKKTEAWKLWSATRTADRAASQADTIEEIRGGPDDCAIADSDEELEPESKQMGEKVCTPTSAVPTEPIAPQLVVIPAPDLACLDSTLDDSGIVEKDTVTPEPTDRSQVAVAASDWADLFSSSSLKETLAAQAT